jgi:hypothetical protein
MTTFYHERYRSAHALQGTPARIRKPQGTDRAQRKAVARNYALEQHSQPQSSHYQRSGHRGG